VTQTERIWKPLQEQDCMTGRRGGGGIVPWYLI
jgi:hypothetical protein